MSGLEKSALSAGIKSFHISVSKPIFCCYKSRFSLNYYRKSSVQNIIQDVLLNWSDHPVDHWKVWNGLQER